MVAQRSYWRELVASALAMTVLLATADAAADGLRCGRKLVSNGAKPHEVQSKCGPPEATEHRLEFETITQRVRVPCPPNSRQAVCEVEQSHTITHSIDTWTYDFGRRRFIHYVVFVDGSLARVETGSYGQKDDDEPEG